MNAAKAIGEYTKGKYHIQVANTLEETLASTDIFKRMLLNFSQERLYNYLLRNEAFEWIKVITSIGPVYFMLQQTDSMHGTFQSLICAHDTHVVPHEMT